MLATVAVVSGISLLMMLGFSMVSPILPLYALSFGVDLAGAGIAVAAYSAVRMLLDLPVGVWSSSVSRRRLMSTGLLMLSAGNIACWAAPSFWVLVAGRLIAGAGSVLFLINALALLGEIAPERRGSVFGGYTSTFLLGGIPGPFLGGLIADFWGLRAPFLVHGLLMLPAAALVYLVEEPGRRGEPASLTLRRLADRRFVLTCVAAGLLFAARLGIRSFLAPVYGAHSLGMSGAEIGLALSGLGLANAISAWPAGLLSDRIGRKPLISLGLIGILVLALLIPLVSGKLLFYALMAALGFVYGFTSPVPALAADNAKSRDLRVPMGFYRTMTDAGGFTGPTVLGALAGSSQQLGLPVFLAVSLFAAASLLAFHVAGEER